MSELHLALLAVAAALLLALYLHGKWQERRLLRRMRDRLHHGIGDPLLQAGLPLREGQDERPGAAWARRDPRAPGPDPGTPVAAERRAAAPPAAAIDAPADPGAAAPAAGAPVETDRGVSSQALRTPPALLSPDWIEDPLLDCSLEIRCSRAVDGVSVIDAAAALAHADWPLPVHFVVWDGRHQQWVLPDRFGYYTDALASIQLADRRQRIERALLDRFVQAVQQLAATLDADVDAPDTGRLALMAQDLDRLCARFDIKIGITVESTGGAWTGPQLRNAAQEAGFVAVGAQRWLCLDAQGDPVYSLQADPAAMHKLTLELDIPATPMSGRPFRAMVDSAWALAQILGARVVDDNGAPIETRSVDAIEAQLGKVYADMQAAGVEPGSARARRLYV